MLQCIKKYSSHDFYVNIRNIKNNYEFVSLSKKTIINVYSVFLRKLHFRSLLMYLNIHYSNINISADYNQFYQPKITTLYLGNKHPGFLFRRRLLK